MSCPAGFVDAAESLEDAVRREVAEELGLVVSEVAYAASQPWPAAGQLMVGMVATVADAALRIDPTGVHPDSHHRVESKGQASRVPLPRSQLEPLPCLPPDEYADIATVPATLERVLDSLEDDHEFLLAGAVFTADLIDTWIDIKREDIDAIRLRPHPHEFELYYDM